MENTKKADHIEKPKRRNYKNELESAIGQIQVLKNQLLRNAADFDNYRKRSDKERFELQNRTNRELVTKLLPVLDDFGRSIETNAEKGDPTALLEGVKLIYKNLFKILQDEGLEPMGSVGKPFDPELHEALLQVDVEGYASDTVIEEHVKGYTFRDQVIRHARVIVSK